MALVAGELGDLSVVRLLGALARDGAGTRVVLVHADPGTVAWDTIGRGAAGVLSRRVSADDIRSAVRLAARGEIALCPEAQAALAAEIRLRRPTEGPPLSRRELEVLRLIAEGLSAPAIAARLQAGHHDGPYALSAPARQARGEGSRAAGVPRDATESPRLAAT